MSQKSIIDSLREKSTKFRNKIEEEIKTKLREKNWENLYESCINEAHEIAKLGQFEVLITLTPEQHLRNYGGDDMNDYPYFNYNWTPAKAYREAFNERVKQLFTESGFTFKCCHIQEYSHGDFLYKFSLSWEKDSGEEYKDYELLNGASDEDSSE
jgi:hypothetical protein